MRVERVTLLSACSCTGTPFNCSSTYKTCGLFCQHINSGVEFKRQFNCCLNQVELPLEPENPIRKSTSKLIDAEIYLTLRFHSSFICSSLGLTPESSARKSVSKRLNRIVSSIMGK